jgi:hypothetical protein
MLYRVLKRLTTGHEPGDWERGDRFKPKVLEALVENGALSPVQGPPLATLDGWKTRADKLLRVGIVDAVDFLTADDTAIMLAFNHKTNRAVKKYKDELMALLEMKMEPQRTRRRRK